MRYGALREICILHGHVFVMLECVQYLLVVRWAGNVAEMGMCNVVTILLLVMTDELMETVDDLGNMAPHHRTAADLE